MIAKFKKNKRDAKENRQSLIFAGFFIALIVVIISFLVISNLKMGQKRAELNAQINKFQKEIQMLEAKRQVLQTQISESSKENYLEKEARERFNLKKPGEEVVAILPLEKKEEMVSQEKKWWNPLTW